MKKILTLVTATLLAVTNLQAQQKVVEKTLEVPANKKVVLNLKFGNDIKITAWDKKEVAIKVTYEINSGKLNDALLLTFKADNESARVKVDLDQDLLKTGKAEDCPDNKANQNYYYNNGRQYFSCTQINYEIMAPRDADLVVETISGNIELRGLTGPVQAKSISGFVDMNWPDRKGAAVALKTITGEVYSDLNLDIPNKKENPIVGYQLQGTLNGGGSAVKLETISNNIYFRKQ
jgi:uncharacterized GH25 family protein